MLKKTLKKYSFFTQMRFFCLFSIVTFNVLLIAKVNAEEITVAVASNFYPSLKLLKQEFESVSPHKINIVSASTGKIYSQIINGAPFDIFMSADTQTPKLLEDKGLAIKGSRFTYAVGRLVLWSAAENLVDPLGDILLSPKINKIALANPKLAPYGKAAHDFILSLKLQYLQDKLVMGENIAQAFHLVASGSAEIGFVALSQIINPQQNIQGSYWLVPETYHQAIEQQLVLLNDKEVSQQFILFLKSAAGNKIIKSFGYQQTSDFASESDSELDSELKQQNQSED